MTGRAIVLVAAIASGVFPVPSAGQWAPKLDRLSVEAGGSFDGSWLEFKQPELLTAESYQQWLRLTLGGYVRDPRVVAYRIVARPLLVQGRYLPLPDSLEADETGSGLLGALRLQLFRTSPMWGQILARRSRDFRPTRLGGAVDEFQSGWSVEFYDRNPLLPMELSYGRERRRLDWSSGPSASRFRSDERTGTLRLSARNKRTTLLLERLAFQQALGGVDFVRRLAYLGHDQRYGAGSRLRSTLRYVDRNARGMVRSIRWRESAHLQQAPAVATDLSFGVARTSGPSGATVQADVRGTVTRTLASGAELAFDAQLQRWGAGVVQRRFAQLGPRGSFARDLPRGFRLTASGGLTFEAHAQGSDGSAFADIVQEPHVVGESGQFMLVRAFADPASIFVTTGNGAVVLEEGLDYRVVESDPFVTILILPGGRVEEGATLLVDYRYEVAPSVSARSLTRFYDLSLSIRGLRLYHRRRAQVDLDELPPDLLPVIRNHDRSTLGVSLTVPWSRLALTGGLERRVQRSDDFDFTERQARASATLRLTSGLYVSVAGRASRLRGGVRPYRSSELERAIEWRPRSDLRMRAYWNDWGWVAPDRDEHFEGFGGVLEWRKPEHTVSFQYDHVVWTGGIERLEDRLSLQLSRTFGAPVR